MRQSETAERIVKGLSDNLYYGGFVLFALLYILLQTGYTYTVALIVAIGLLECANYIAGTYLKKEDRQAIFFTVFFLWISHNRFYDFFDLRYNTLIFTGLTIMLGIFIKRYGLEYDKDFEREEKNKVVRFISVVLLVFLFFGFQLRNVGILYSWRVYFILSIVLFWWCETFYRFSVTRFKGILKAENLYKRAENKIIYLQDVYKTWIIIFGIVFIIGTLFSLLYYPGIISPDSFANYQAANEFDNIEYRSDIHSFGYILFTKAVLSVSSNYYVLTLSMIIGFAAIWASFLTYLYKQGLRRRTVIWVTIFWMSFPCNIYLLFCTWKDIPFAISMLLLSFSLTKYSMETDFDQKIGNLIILCASLICTAVFRSNGQVVFVGIAAVFIINGIRKRVSRRVLITIGISVFALFMFKSPVFTLLKVQPSPAGFSSIPFIDGIWENLYSGEYVDDEVINFVEEELLPIEDFVDAYAENYTNIYVFQNGYANINLKRAKDAYLWCLKHHPKTTLLARLKRTYNVWSVFSSSIYPINRNYYARLRDFSQIKSEYCWKYIEKFEWLRQRFDHWFDDNYLIGAIQFGIGRCGWNMVLWLICAVELFRIGKSKILIAITPAVLNTIGLFVGCCFPDYRYFYPMFVLTVPFFLVLLLGEKG